MFLVQLFIVALIISFIINHSFSFFYFFSQQIIIILLLSHTFSLMISLLYIFNFFPLHYISYHRIFCEQDLAATVNKGDIFTAEVRTLHST